jgi:hypothetical protein
LELLEAGLRVVLVEKGRPIHKRRCPSGQRNCKGCKRCDIMSGWGGAGAFSDGKLTLTGEVGGWLGQYVPPGQLDALLHDADRLWLRFGADTATHGPDAATAERLIAESRRAGMRLVPMTIRHLGTDRSPEILGAMYEYLVKAGAGMLLDTEVTAIISEEGTVKGVELADGTLLSADFVIAAPGREGAEWLTDQAARLGLVLSNNQVDIGVRVECPAAIMEPLTRTLYEANIQ